MEQDRTFLVLGATGRTGGRVAARLRQLGHTVRARSRSTSPRFDWSDVGTWKAAVKGVDGVYLMVQSSLFPSAVDAPQVGFPTEEVAKFCQFAYGEGVAHIVLLSGRTGLAGSPYILDLEQAVRGGGTDWTMLRPGTFAQNFADEPFRSAIIAGHVEGMDTGGRDEDFIDVADIADIAAHTLATPGHHGSILELSGPRAITSKEAVNIIGRTLGRTVTYAEIPLDDFARQTRERGVDEQSLKFILTAAQSIRDGFFEPRTGVQDTLGRQPRAFEDFVVEAAAAGVWGPITPD